MNTIQIFKPGKHVAASGGSFNFSESDVTATVAAYDPSLHEAPVVVGHPRHDLPAYGWIKSLSFAEGVLSAEPQQVDPAFAELVDAGRYKKISASFYHPDSPSNPVPGVYYLRHVGFLGAQPPAVKGLRNPEFNESEEQIVEVEFSEQGYAWSAIAGLFRSLREYVIGKDGAEKADQMIPNWTIDQIQRTATEVQEAEASAGAPVPAFNEPTTTPNEGEVMSLTPQQVADMQAENERLRNQVAQAGAREQSLAAREADQVRRENVAFCESLVASAQLHPNLKDNAAALLTALASAPAGAGQEAVVEFSEGGQLQQLPVAGALKALLQAQPKIVEFQEVGNERGRVPIAEDPNAIANAAVQFQESERVAGRIITTAQAVNHVLGK
ncbi:peptidase [Duganella sp. CY15W]|uniref:peptidase n=1 Tax=Duganella sp. CY15W TaxID=2692172 RepID=UPI001928D0F1|nr:peptidase [Duganella sp. CY15W]